MTYRGVVRHVRMWRGTIHKWSTVYQFVGTPSKALDTAACGLLLAQDDAMCVKSTAVDGGTYACEIYDQATGGVPIASQVLWDPSIQGNWTGYGHSSYWPNTAVSLANPAEAALGVKWIMGLSKSGKPVYARKWWHAVPEIAPGSANQDIPAATVTALHTGAMALVGVLASYGVTLGSESGRFAGTPTVDVFYQNHQMQRGRRRKALVKANGQYTGPSIQVPVLEN